MSTDYGFKCRECDTNRTVDNLRYHSIELLEAVLANLPVIEKLRAIDGLTVSAYDSYYNFQDALTFAIEHRRDGHTIVIADEYGREFDQCRGYWTCGHCGHAEDCKLNNDHKGDHERKAP